MKKTSTQTKPKLSIQSFIEEYHLKVNGVTFWTPYPYKNLDLSQRREYAEEEPTPPPFKGRGNPSEIKNYLIEHLNEVEEKFKTSQQYRKFMASLRLGVDCSGFSYYVLDQLLRLNYDLNLADHLYKSREELLSIYDNPVLTPPEDLDRGTVESYPDWVSLSQIMADWGNKPRYVVSSEVFVSAGSTVAVDIENLQPGDMVAMMGYQGIGHHLVVVESSRDKIIYAHSAGRHGDKNGLGGVEYGQIEITDPTKSIEKQTWSDQLILEKHEFNPQPLRRLKVLAKDN